jgi:hypothetical protein
MSPRPGGWRPRSGGLKEQLGIGIGIAAVLGSLVLFGLVIVFSFDLLHSDKLTGKRTHLQAVTITGDEQTVFSWSRDACGPQDIPDLPARAFRDSHGDVQLIAAHLVNRRFVGPELGRVRHRCAITMRSRMDPDPAVYADREWVASPFTPDGRTVYALVHDEYQGSEHPGRCPSGVYQKCWYNAITLAVSTDGGRTYHHAAPPPRHLVASVPYRYEPDFGPVGVFEPSNIVRNEKDGYYYALARTTAHQDQQFGACALRTRTLDDPASWRAWNGSSFDARLASPYAGDDRPPPDHVCAPVSPKEIGNMNQSLTFNTYFGKWLLVGSTQDYVPSQRRNVTGIYYSLSDDLVHWSRRRLVREVEFAWSYQCGDPNPIAYPSVLDPRSKSRNFGTSGQDVYLYFTRFHYSSCKQTLNRDLVRVPIRFTK